MALMLVVILGGAFIGAAMVLRAAGQSKFASDGMLREYSQLLAHARDERHKGKPRGDEDEP